jgi:hypothetical protein
MAAYLPQDWPEAVRPRQRGLPGERGGLPCQDHLFNVIQCFFGVMEFVDGRVRARTRRGDHRPVRRKLRMPVSQAWGLSK